MIEGRRSLIEGVTKPNFERKAVGIRLVLPPPAGAGLFVSKKTPAIVNMTNPIAIFDTSVGSH